MDRIHAILEERGLKQKDLANMLGKKESEISKWMRGTHNFTIDTISSIEKVLGQAILQIAETNREVLNIHNRIIIPVRV